MVETTRGVNGKFTKGAGGGNTGDLGSIKPDDGTAPKNKSGDTVIDPATLGSGTGSGDGDNQPKRKPGRPSGAKTKTGTGKTETQVDLGALNSLLYSTHCMMAALLKAPEFMLSQDEADTLAKAAANVARHYNLQASQKALDWGNLAFCMGATYAPRFYAIGQRKREEKKQNQSDTLTNNGVVFSPG